MHKEEDTISEVVVVGSWFVTATTKARLEISSLLLSLTYYLPVRTVWFHGLENLKQNPPFSPSRRSFPWGRFAGGLRQITGYINFTVLPMTLLTRITSRNPLQTRLQSPLFHNPAPQFPLSQPSWKIDAWPLLQPLQFSLAPMQPQSPLVLHRPSALSNILWPYSVTS